MTKNSDEGIDLLDAYSADNIAAFEANPCLTNFVGGGGVASASGAQGIFASEPGTEGTVAAPAGQQRLPQVTTVNGQQIALGTAPQGTAAVEQEITLEASAPAPVDSSLLPGESLVAQAAIPSAEVAPPRRVVATTWMNDGQTYHLPSTAAGD